MWWLFWIRWVSGRTPVLIAAEFANPIYSLVARPEYRFADLRGKLIGLADEAVDRH